MTRDYVKKDLEDTGLLLRDIEQAVADGAVLDREIAKALGKTIDRWYNLKYGRGKGGEELATKVTEAIKKGKDRQRETMLGLAEYELVRSIRGYEYEEKTTEITESPSGRVVKQKTVKKRVLPNVTAMFFILVNKGEGRWKSINKESSEFQKPPSPEDNNLAIPGFDPTKIIVTQDADSDVENTVV